MSQEKIIDMIKKLRALGTSSNQHEAEAAQAKAAELMAKYRINQSMLEDHETLEEYVVEDFQTFRFVTFLIDCIYCILREHYGVEGMLARKDGEFKALRMIGKKSDMLMAKYAHDVLHDSFKRSFDVALSEDGINETERNTFYRGMRDGILAHMGTARRKAEEKTLTTQQISSRYALVTQRDADELKKKMKEAFGKLVNNRKSGFDAHDSGYAYDQGHKQGRQTFINKPLSGKGQNKALSN
jgi:Protein of unknown function (DUF2786)